MSVEFDKVYKLTVIRAPDIVDIKGLDRSFFEEFETITEITDQRIEYKIEKHLRTTPNQGEITLTNLAAATRDAFVHGPAKIRLEAGYDNTPRLLFLGDVRYASNEHDGTEWLTKLQVGDGSRAYANARVNRSYAKGTPLDTILKDIAKSFGVSLPAVSQDLRGRISTGEVITGYTSDELTRVLAPFGFEWSFQNGRLQLLRADEVLAGSVRVISQDDGMIGAPVMDPPKIRAPAKTSNHHGGGSRSPRVPKLKVKHTLYPELTPGEKIEIQSRSLNGTFRIDVVKHDGDSHGKDWITEIEAIAV